MMPAKRANGLLKPNTEPNATIGDEPAKARRECRHRRRCFRLEGVGPLAISHRGGEAEDIVETSAAPRRRLARAGFQPQTAALRFAAAVRLYRRRCFCERRYRADPRPRTSGFGMASGRQRVD